MKDKLTELQEIKRNKQNLINKTPSYSWKRKLYALEIQLVENKIKIELLKRQYQ